MATYKSLEVSYENWMVPFIGRMVNDVYEEKFNHNGYYPSDYDDWYFEKAIILNLKPSISDDGELCDIDYYKVYEACGGPGRPITYDRSLNKKDINHFVTVLNECTDGRAESVIREYMLENQSDLPQEVLEQIIEISFTYPEILYNPNFWESNPKLVAKKYVKKALKLLSVIDWRAYGNGEELTEAVNKRLYKMKLENVDTAISEAVHTQDDELFNSTISELNNPKEHLGDMQYAIETKRYDYVYMLARNGVEFILDKYDVFFSDDQLIELAKCENVRWTPNALNRIYNIDSTLLDDIFSNCYMYDGEWEVDYYQSLIEWAFNLQDLEVVKRLVASDCKIYLTRSVKNFKIRKSLVDFVEQMLEAPKEFRGYVSSVFRDVHYFNTCVETLFESLAKKKDFDGMDKIIIAYDYKFPIKMFSYVTPKDECKRWTKKNDTALRYFIEKYKAPEARYSLTETRIIRFLIARIIHYCPDDTVEYFFKHFKGFNLYEETSSDIQAHCKGANREYLLGIAKQAGLIY